MKMPGAEINCQVTVEVTQLWCLLKAHLKDSTLDARTNDNALPIVLKQIFDQCLHRLFRGLKVTQRPLRAVELFKGLSLQQFGWGGCSHRRLLLHGRARDLRSQKSAAQHDLRTCTTCLVYSRIAVCRMGRNADAAGAHAGWHDDSDARLRLSLRAIPPVDGSVRDCSASNVDGDQAMLVDMFEAF